MLMLKRLPFPEHMKDVPEIAASHHETMIGTGYPRGLKKEDMTIPARIMAIADIFEALTAADRPYKRPKTLSDSLRIMSRMRDDRHIDAELFDLFLSSGIYKRYAEQYLDQAQRDQVDIRSYLEKM
jgi:HD-GYP domain-containing protein (c-di-GMP phosphodiesterase class II)